MERGMHWCTYIRRIEKRWREERREEGSEWWFVEKGGGRGVRRMPHDDGSTVLAYYTGNTRWRRIFPTELSRGV